MYDCRFQNAKLTHLHVSLERGTATLMREGHGAGHGGHAYDLDRGLESEGRLVRPLSGDRYTIELFLSNQHFAQRQDEKVVIRVATDGRARLEAQAPGAKVRTLDFGTCSRTQRHPDPAG